MAPVCEGLNLKIKAGVNHFLSKTYPKISAALITYNMPYRAQRRGATFANLFFQSTIRVIYKRDLHL